MRGIPTEITKEEFLRACNLKIQRDNELAEDEARARAEARANAEWDAWYRNVPSACKQGFDYGGFSYRVNSNARTITKERIGTRTGLNFSTFEINSELGI